MSDVKAALLRVLMSGKGYGLELMARVEDHTNGKVRIRLAIYPALRELEDAGLLHSYEADPTPERGDRPRRYYELTDAGRNAAEVLP